MRIILQKYRVEASMSQLKLALRVGVTRIYISNIENGKCLPSPDVIIKIADVFNICPKDLIDFCDGCEKTNKKHCKKHFF